MIKKNKYSILTNIHTHKQKYSKNKNNYQITIWIEMPHFSWHLNAKCHHCETRTKHKASGFANHTTTHNFTVATKFGDISSNAMVIFRMNFNWRSKIFQFWYINRCWIEKKNVFQKKTKKYWKTIAFQSKKKSMKKKHISTKANNLQ